MSQHPIPVVICSALTDSGSEASLKAMEYGAVDIIQKPKSRTKEFLEEYSVRICDVVKAASAARTKKVNKIRQVEPKLTADAVIAKPTSRQSFRQPYKVVVVGASTGDRSLADFLEALPWNAPGMSLCNTCRNISLARLPNPG
jgi:two-component system chemotaxis response regulator CheB